MEMGIPSKHGLEKMGCGAEEIGALLLHAWRHKKQTKDDVPTKLVPHMLYCASHLARNKRYCLEVVTCRHS